MFGYILPNLESLGEEEKLRYHAVYCGVCRSIRARYGQRCRLAVSYDMTFLAMVLGSLYEPEEHASQKRCPVHPIQTRQVAQSEFTDYAADLSIATSALTIGATIVPPRQGRLRWRWRFHIVRRSAASPKPAKL